jgi:hypothetical protein
MRVPYFKPIPSLILTILLIGTLALSACTLPEAEAPPPVAPPVAEDTPEPEPEPPVAEAEPATEGEVITEEQGIEQTETLIESAYLSDMRGIEGAEGLLIRAMWLTGYDFVNQDDQVSGNVEDFLVDTSTGNILFARVNYGGLFNIGGATLAMPLSAFTWGGDHLILNFDEEALERFPDVGADWPDITDAAWDDAINAYWRDLTLDPGFDFGESDSAGVMWLSEMSTLALVDVGAGVGTIQDYLVALGDGHIQYVLFVFGTAGAGQTPFILPYSALDMQNLGDDEIGFDTAIDLTTLQTAPRYDPMLFPDTEILREGFSAEIDSYWAERGFKVK